jgi:hypothetical protein
LLCFFASSSTDSLFNNCTVYSYDSSYVCGGAVYVYIGEVELSGGGEVVIISDLREYDNGIVTFTDTEARLGYGGAIFIHVSSPSSSPSSSPLVSVIGNKLSFKNTIASFGSQIFIGIENNNANQIEEILLNTILFDFDYDLSVLSNLVGGLLNTNSNSNNNNLNNEQNNNGYEVFPFQKYLCKKTRTEYKWIEGQCIDYAECHKKCGDGMYINLYISFIICSSIIARSFFCYNFFSTIVLRLFLLLHCRRFLPFPESQLLL